MVLCTGGLSFGDSVVLCVAVDVVLLILIFGAGGMGRRLSKPTSAMVDGRCCSRRFSTVLFGLSVVVFRFVVYENCNNNRK